MEDSPLPEKARLAGAAVLANATRRRVVSLGTILLTVAGVAIAIRLLGDNGTKEAAMAAARGCYSDDDCPDGTYCDALGLCTPGEGLPLRVQSPVLGRGRGGEGADVQAVSLERKGQNS